MLSQHEIMQTIQMIDQQHLDVRTITMGISLLSCARSDPKQACGAIYDKITRYAEKLVSTGEAIEKEFGIPIVNKRISVTPIALVAAAAETDNYAPFAAALDRAEATNGPAAALQLPDGRIITGKTSKLLGASSALLLNALKTLGNIQDGVHLISPIVIEPIQHLKVEHLGNHNPRLHMDEVLIALSISAATNPTAELAMQQLDKLRGSEAHSSVILSSVDVGVFRKLGINLTCEPRYQSKKLYHK